MITRHLHRMLALLLCSGVAAAQQQEVTLGVFAYQGERAALADWAGLASYLERSVPGYRFK